MGAEAGDYLVAECPYCEDHDEFDHHEFSEEPQDGDSYNRKCGNCGKEYIVSIHFTTIYCTHKLEGDA